MGYLLGTIKVSIKVDQPLPDETPRHNSSIAARMGNPEERVTMMKDDVFWKVHKKDSHDVMLLDRGMQKLIAVAASELSALDGDRTEPLVDERRADETHDVVDLVAGKLSISLKNTGHI